MARVRQRPGSLAGVVLVEALPSPPDNALLWGVAAALTFTSLVTLGRALFVPKVHERERDTVPLTPRRSAWRSDSGSCSASCSA